ERATGDDDAIMLARDGGREQPVEDVVEHGAGIALEWISIAAAAWTVCEQPIALFRLLIRNLGWKRYPAASLRDHRELARITVVAAAEAPGAVFLTIAFDRKATVGQIGKFAHRADAAAPLARRHDAFAQFVAVH